MAYTLSIPVILGLGQTGLTLTAALFNTDHTSAAGLTTTTLSETAGAKGSYLWTGTIPSAHRGYIKFSSSGVEKAIAGINPEDVEYLGAIQTVLSGITSLGNWLRAMARKSAPNATALSELNSGGGTYDATTDALQALRDRGDAAWVTGSTTFTLSQVAASVQEAVADSGSLTVRQAASWSQALTSCGNVTSRTKLYLTVKARASDLDSEAVFQIEATAGLVVLNGAVAAVPAWGTLTVDDATDGDLSFTLKPKATVVITPGTYLYDVKMITSTGADLMTAGTLTVLDIVTRAVS